MMKYYTLISSLFLILLASFPAFADSFRCNNKLVKAGDTSIEVKIKCGKPFDTEYIGKARISNEYVNIERYTYVPEKGKFVKILEFHNGTLVTIINGPRV